MSSILVESRGAEEACEGTELDLVYMEVLRHLLFFKFVLFNTPQVTAVGPVRRSSRVNWGSHSHLTVEGFHS